MFAVDEAETFEVFDPGKPLFFVVADVVREIVLFEQFLMFLLEAPCSSNSPETMSLTRRPLRPVLSI